eukprot:TRINITY_DN12308_c0_g1_i1.p1 TRINITY_DN12308_c0_g1~~TRINITY_DN12308_c0_g1_i1.p1  ORF type:complete len:609 (+),score=161.52 TRINITY_DN12308_c0_g1_i1:50-1876(+)
MSTIEKCQKCACQSYKQQRWRKDVCVTCFHSKNEHLLMEANELTIPEKLKQNITEMIKKKPSGSTVRVKRSNSNLKEVISLDDSNKINPESKSILGDTIKLNEMAKEMDVVEDIKESKEKDKKIVALQFILQQNGIWIRNLLKKLVSPIEYNSLITQYEKEEDNYVRHATQSLNIDNLYHRSKSQLEYAMLLDDDTEDSITDEDLRIFMQASSDRKNKDVKMKLKEEIANENKLKQRKLISKQQTMEFFSMFKNESDKKNAFEGIQKVKNLVGNLDLPPSSVQNIIEYIVKTGINGQEKKSKGININVNNVNNVKIHNNQNNNYTNNGDDNNGTYGVKSESKNESGKSRSPAYETRVEKKMGSPVSNNIENNNSINNSSNNSINNNSINNSSSNKLEIQEIQEVSYKPSSPNNNTLNNNKTNNNNLLSISPHSANNMSTSPKNVNNNISTSPTYVVGNNTNSNNNKTINNNTSSGNNDNSNKNNNLTINNNNINRNSNEKNNNKTENNANNKNIVISNTNKNSNTINNNTVSDHKFNFSNSMQKFNQPSISPTSSRTSGPSKSNTNNDTSVLPKYSEPIFKVNHNTKKKKYKKNKIKNKIKKIRKKYV